MFRAQERLKEARVEAQRPGPEKAARKQELNKKIRVSGTNIKHILSFRSFTL